MLVQNQSELNRLASLTLLPAAHKSLFLGAQTRVAAFGTPSDLIASPLGYSMRPTLRFIGIAPIKMISRLPR